MSIGGSDSELELLTGNKGESGRKTRKGEGLNDEVSAYAV